MPLHEAAHLLSNLTRQPMDKSNTTWDGLLRGAGWWWLDSTIERVPAGASPRNIFHLLSEMAITAQVRDIKKKRQRGEVS